MSNIFAVCFSKLHLKCPGDVFEEKPFKNWWFSCNFCALSKQFWSFAGKFFMAFNKQITIRFSKTQFPCPGKQIENFFCETFWFFSLLSTLTKFFWFSGKKSSPRAVKISFGESKWRLWGFFFEKTLIFCNLCTLSGKVSHFCKTFTTRFPQHQSKCPGKIFAKRFCFKTDGIILFPFFQRKNRGSWLKNLRRGFWNHNLHVQGNNLRNFFLKKAFFLIDFVI